MMTDTIESRTTVGDAYVQSDGAGNCAIGTDAYELRLAWCEHELRLTSCRNKLVDPPCETLDTSAPQPPLIKLNPNAAVGPGENVTRSAATTTWQLATTESRQIAVGGRPAIALIVTLEHGDLQAALHFTAFPHSAIIRCQVVLENTGSHAIRFDPQNHHLLAMDLRADNDAPLTHYWLGGDHPPPELGVQGMLYSADVGAPYYRSIAGEMAAQFTPWTGLLRDAPAADGIFAALEYLGAWTIHLYRETPGPVHLLARIPDIDADFELAPGERLGLPVVTIGVFRDSLDDMGVRLYDWQYEYLWSYTNDEYYARPQWTTEWWGDSMNLQENFAGRLAMDLDWPDKMREAGMEILWDDAGWSETAAPFSEWSEGGYGGIWRGTQQGPDFSRTLRYLTRCGMKWVLWFNGNYSPGLMASKAGAWGNFQWRTDDLGTFNLRTDAEIRERVTRFLRQYPGCSFQTCSGGGSVAHMFDMQNIAGQNYFSDYHPHTDRTNCYFSYLDPPDKWADTITALQAFWLREEGFDMQEMSPVLLTMTPGWGMSPPGTIEALSKQADLYRYLLREGVAGRWSHVFHPVVDGDEAFYYFQRLSYCRTRGLIIPKHKAPGAVTVYPHGLLPEHLYAVDFESDRPGDIRTGAELMDAGVRIDTPVAGELIFFGLPQRPGSGTDTVAPQPPGAVLQRGETNIGHSGVGIYWSPGTDDNWVSHYEVQRGDKVVGIVRFGTYLFDHSPGSDPAAVYAVRTVDGDGNVSAWCAAQRLADEPRVADALAGHGADWLAESSEDGLAFSEMRWIPPESFPTADWCGTARQPGGVEGYWQAAAARIGRGWQQADTVVRCVRTWTTPESGTIRIVGRAMKEFYRRGEGDPLRVRILHNRRVIWPDTADGWAVVALNDLAGATHDVRLEVEAGDQIRFVLAPADDTESAVVAWMPRITMLDETSAPAAPTTVASANAARVMRINCGADQPYVDRSGNQWEADRGFDGGEPLALSVPVSGALPTADDSALYQSGRCGEAFTYTIPVAPGLYALRLKFAECVLEWSFMRPFDLEINGRIVLRNFDVCHAARAPGRALDRVFRHLVPDADGQIVLRFRAGWEPLPEARPEAVVQAIELLPEEKSELRIAAGAETPYIDWNSFVWEADTCCRDGRVIRSDSPVDQASPTLYDQALYQTARSGRELRYELPAAPGLYTVHLKFAELWLQEPGQRPMDIEINGNPIQKSWDPAAFVGCTGMAIDLRAENITPDADDRIALVIRAAGEHDAILQAVELV